MVDSNRYQFICPRRRHVRINNGIFMAIFMDRNTGIFCRGNRHRSAADKLSYASLRALYEDLRAIMKFPQVRCPYCEKVVPRSKYLFKMLYGKLICPNCGNTSLIERKHWLVYICVGPALMTFGVFMQSILSLAIPAMTLMLIVMLIPIWIIMASYTTVLTKTDKFNFHAYLRDFVDPRNPHRN